MNENPGKYTVGSSEEKGWELNCHWEPGHLEVAGSYASGISASLYDSWPYPTHQPPLNLPAFDYCTMITFPHFLCLLWPWFYSSYPLRLYLVLCCVCVLVFHFHISQGSIGPIGQLGCFGCKQQKISLLHSITSKFIRNSDYQNLFGI